MAYVRPARESPFVTQPRKQLESTIAPGDVVTLQDRIELMTVEGVRAGAFGTEVACCWFDADDCLRFRAFPLSKLDIFPRPIPERPIAKGTEVRLRSRGPIMTVRRLERRPDGVFAECVWTGASGGERRRMFPKDGLVLTMLERFHDLGGREV